MTTVRVMERLSRHSALGLRFWDVATGDACVHGLQVGVFRAADPAVVAPALPNRSGLYVAHAVPGLRAFEFADDSLGDPWATPASLYRLSVSDPQGRFLPMVLDAALPARALLSEGLAWLSPASPLALPGASGSPSSSLLAGIPLFSAPGRPVPEPLAVVYAQMRESSTGLSVAWGLLEVRIDSRPCGLGLADDQGRVAVMFPYPEPPRMQLASPPEARNSFNWQVELRAFWSRPSPPLAPTAAADLGTVLDQLTEPRNVVASTLSPGASMSLSYRVPLTARTEGAAVQDASYLLVA